jgi:molybdenum cofactor synthesis domain-containing protein
LAALGEAKVEVYTVPTVAVLSTGGEVTEPGMPLPPGKIYDINAYSLCTAVRESGGKPVYAGVVPDESVPLRKALEQALASADVVLTSGGVSVGPKDIIPATVDSLGKPGVFISGIAVKPGKPATVALIGDKPVFSFPGHPTSALLIYHLLARPIIQAMAGKQPSELASVRAVVDRRMFSAKGRRTFVMVRLVLDEEKGLVAEAVESGASGAITTLAKADGFVEIAENQQFVDVGEEVRVWLFRENR